MQAMLVAPLPRGEQRSWAQAQALINRGELPAPEEAAQEPLSLLVPEMGEAQQLWAALCRVEALERQLAAARATALELDAGQRQLVTTLQALQDAWVAAACSHGAGPATHGQAPHKTQSPHPQQLQQDLQHSHGLWH